MKESTVVKKLRKSLEKKYERNIDIYNVHGHSLGKVGQPDLQIIKPLKGYKYAPTLYVEAKRYDTFKKAYKGMSPAQKARCMQMVRCTAIYILYWSTGCAILNKDVQIEKEFSNIFELIKELENDVNK